LESGEIIKAHNPNDYSFIRKHNPSKKEISPSGQYFYSKRLDFSPGQDYLMIYKTNSEIYQTANYVDVCSSSLAILSSYKFFN
jgi:hypothetical protein